MAKLLNRIAIDQKVHHGKPVIKGTRVPVEVVLGALAGGMDIKEVCKEYSVTSKDVQAAIEYALLSVSREEVRPIAKTPA